MSDFNFLENLPFIVFSFTFIVTAIIFLFGALTLLFSKNLEKIESGRKMLIKSLYLFFIILLITIVFFIGSWLLDQGEKLKPPAINGEFPPSSTGKNFPPPPEI